MIEIIILKKSGATGAAASAPKSRSSVQSTNSVAAGIPSNSHAKAEVPEPETTLFINSGCECGTVDPLKLKQYLPKITGTLEELYNRLIMTLNDCMISPSSKLKTAKKKFADFHDFETEIKNLVKFTGACENLVSFNEGPCANCLRKKESRHKG